jgi:hypothetical protein
LKNSTKEGSGRINKDLNKGSVCAKCFSWHTILMAAFCFLNNVVILVAELQPQICIP